MTFFLNIEVFRICWVASEPLRYAFVWVCASLHRYGNQNWYFSLINVITSSTMLDTNKYIAIFKLYINTTNEYYCIRYTLSLNALTLRLPSIFWLMWVCTTHVQIEWERELATSGNAPRLRKLKTAQGSCSRIQVPMLCLFVDHWFTNKPKSEKKSLNWVQLRHLYLHLYRCPGLSHIDSHDKCDVMDLEFDQNHLRPGSLTGHDDRIATKWNNFSSALLERVS